MIKINKLCTPARLTTFKSLSAASGGLQGYYDLDRDTKEELRNQLLDESQHRCAYCMKPLFQKTIIEHIIPFDSLSKIESLEYDNLVINCNTSKVVSKLKHLKSCSDAKQNKILLKVGNVLFSTIESYVCYKANGEIFSSDVDIENDMKTLNLNNSNLIENRYTVLLKTKEKIKDMIEKGIFTNARIDKIENKMRTTRFPYHGIAINILRNK